MSTESESDFLAAYEAAKFPKPSVAVDVVLLTIDEEHLQTLLVRRLELPDRDKWSLPGGFIRMDESLDDTAARVLLEKAGLRGVFLEQLYTFGEPKRDLRTRIISIVYYALVSSEQLRAVAVGPNQCLAEIRVGWPGELGGAVDPVDRQGRKLPIAFEQPRHAWNGSEAITWQAQLHAGGLCVAAQTLHAASTATHSRNHKRFHR